MKFDSVVFGAWLWRTLVLGSLGCLFVSFVLIEDLSLLEGEDFAYEQRRGAVFGIGVWILAGILARVWVRHSQRA